MTGKTLNTIVVDDSDTQRALICNLVEKNSNLKLIGHFRNGILALNGIRKNKVDLILLDIEMPIVSGFDLLESLEEPPLIILISDKSDHALKAFDYDITDYLQKPVDKMRFNTAVVRVLNQYHRLSNANEKKDFVIVTVNLQKKKVYLNSIKWIEALGDYIKLVTTEGNYLVLSTMKAFLKKMPKNQFVRIHKSYIANVRKVDNWSNDKVEIDGTKLPMSRLRKEEFERILIPT